MSKSLFLLLLTINIFALEISVYGAKENQKLYSTLHIKDPTRFTCQEIKDDFSNVTKIICSFSKTPSQKIQKLRNDFFEVDTEVKKNTFFVTIKPYKKIKLFPVIFDLTKENTTFITPVETSKHWMIVGYEGLPPHFEIKKRADNAIDFPFTFTEIKLPYVGSLDFQGNPVNIKRVGDVSEYIKIKKLYDDKNYEQAEDMLEAIMKEYPDTLFLAEFLFYKIRVCSKLQKNECVIDTAKKYLTNYSSDDNVAEVLSLIAKSYSAEGLNTDADYFFDRLFSEHQDSVYAQWGRIYMAKDMESAGGSKKAREVYDKVVQESQDVDAALEAAFRLALSYASGSKMKESSKYVDKVFKVKPEIFFQNMSDSMNMMYNLAEASQYEASSNIAKSILKKLDSDFIEYEEVLKNSGIWLAKTEAKKEALVYLDRYLKEYGDGRFAKEVKAVKDSLFFDTGDANSTKNVANYNNLIKEYKNDSIGSRALYEKAKLLMKNQKFSEVLSMEKELLKLSEYKDIPKMIQDSAIERVKQALSAKECSTVLTLLPKYKLQVAKEWEDGVYDCALKGANYALAKIITVPNLKSKDLQLREKWLYKHIVVDFSSGNYKSVIEASKELLTLIGINKSSQHLDVHRYLFDTYQRLQNSNKMIEEIIEIEKFFKKDHKDLERYVAAMAVGSDKKDNNIVIEYGRKIMSIQASSKTASQSPFVEFTLYQAHLSRDENAKAYEVIKSLDSVRLSAGDRSRQKYLLGNVSSRLQKKSEAKKAYDDAIKADKNSAWAKLAISAKAIE